MKQFSVVVLCLWITVANTSMMLKSDAHTAPQKPTAVLPKIVRRPPPTKPGKFVHPNPLKPGYVPANFKPLKIEVYRLPNGRVVPKPQYNIPAPKTAGVVRASWYGPYFHGRRAADGSIFDKWSMTVAHRTLPFGTKVKLVNPKTKKSVVAKVRDRGPYIHGRDIDCSEGVATKLGFKGSGVTKLQCQVLQIGDGKYRRQ